MEDINIYCDESCHLEKDNINVMVIGSVWCPKKKVKDITKRIIDIKLENNTPKNAEIKWNKIGPAKERLYMSLINYFFDDDDLHFRAIIIPDKSILDHDKYNQTHDDFYYKMYFDMLKTILSPINVHNIYIDIKDNHSYKKAQKLREVCCNNVYDFSKRIIKKIQPVRSREVQILQLADIIIGAVSYVNRKFPENFQKSQTKIKIINKIRERSGYSLNRTTLYKEDKVNLLMWDGSKNGNK